MIRRASGPSGARPGRGRSRGGATRRAPGLPRSGGSSITRGETAAGALSSSYPGPVRGKPGSCASSRASGLGGGSGRQRSAQVGPSWALAASPEGTGVRPEGTGVRRALSSAGSYSGLSVGGRPREPASARGAHSVLFPVRGSRRAASSGETCEREVRARAAELCPARGKRRGKSAADLSFPCTSASAPFAASPPPSPAPRVPAGPASFHSCLPPDHSPDRAAEKEFVKAVYCHPAYLTSMQSTS